MVSYSYGPEVRLGKHCRRAIDRREIIEIDDRRRAERHVRPRRGDPAELAVLVHLEPA